MVGAIGGLRVVHPSFVIQPSVSSSDHKRQLLIYPGSIQIKASPSNHQLLQFCCLSREFPMIASVYEIKFHSEDSTPRFSRNVS